jgi:hypothetical protein
MAQRFLNQKLGKRMSRKTVLQKARIAGQPARPRAKSGFAGRNVPERKAP